MSTRRSTAALLVGVVGFVGMSYSISKQVLPQPQKGGLKIAGAPVSASKHAQMVHRDSSLEVSVPRGESTPRDSRSTEALLFGVVGLVGMSYSISKQVHPQPQQGGLTIEGAVVSASKHAVPKQPKITADVLASRQKQGIAGTMDGWAPRGESMPSDSRSTDALESGDVGVLGMLINPIRSRNSRACSTALMLQLRNT